jgi:hypothetical protein
LLSQIISIIASLRSLPSRMRERELWGIFCINPNRGSSVMMTRCGPLGLDNSKILPITCFWRALQLTRLREKLRDFCHKLRLTIRFSQTRKINS